MTTSDEPLPYENLIAILTTARKASRVSQAELAERAGISNKTISDYERGKFGPTKRPRPETVMRLAIALDHDPKEWLRTAGLSFDSSDLTRATASVTAKSTGPSSHQFDTLEELRTQRYPIVRVSSHQAPIFREFDRDHIRLLVKLINNSWDCTFIEQDSVVDQIAHLRSGQPRSHLAVGLIDTLARRAEGLRFILYGGLNSTISALMSSTKTAVNWSLIRRRSPDVLAVTINGEMGDSYLRVVLGYDEQSGNIVSTDIPDVRGLAAFYSDQVERHPQRLVIFCASDFRCYSLIRDGGLRWRPRLVGQSDPVLDDPLPVFENGLVVVTEDRDFGDLLTEAARQALLNAPTRLAEIYAQLLAKLIPLEQPVGHEFAFARLFPSQSMTPLFIRELRAKLLTELKNRNFETAQNEAIVDYALAEAQGWVDRSQLADQLATLSAQLKSLMDSVASVRK